MEFKEMKLSEKMITSLERLGIKTPSPIQCEVIPAALKGSNVVGISDTGSGKTYAFLVPILERIDVSDNNIQVVIISPTRELAMQLYKVCMDLVNEFDPNIMVKRFIGGTAKTEKIQNCQIAIGTVGRMHDLFIKDSSLRVDKAHTIVIDEADMVFEDNFITLIDEMKAKLKSNVQYLIFSATISQQLSAFIKKYLKNTLVVNMTNSRGISSNVSHIKIKCKFGKKDTMLLNVLSTFNPYACLIFASKQTEAERLYYFLSENNYNVALLHGGLEPRKRNRIIKEILADKYQYVVCSDIASRGLDIKMVTHVISYDLPSDINFYTHRSGRSGRFDNTGYSIVLYDEDDNAKLHRITKLGMDLVEYAYVNGEFLPRKKVKTTEKVVRENKGGSRKVRVSPNYKNKNSKSRRGRK